MPIENLNRYTCPVTKQVAYGTALPEAWFVIQGEVFAPEAQVPLAQYVVDHPAIGFTDLLRQLTANLETP